MILSTFDEERKYFADGGRLVVGIDEVGRGPLVGPVVAAAAMYVGGLSASEFVQNAKFPDSEVENNEQMRLIRDSKLLSEKQRTVAMKIIAQNFVFGIGVVDHHTIDRINILQAAQLAMKKAYTDIVGKLANIDKDKLIVLVDGRDEIAQFSPTQCPIIGGDQKVKSIAAASIVAKITRDQMIMALDKVYPQYGFAQHKGYGTKQHMEALRKYGPTPMHRASFKPVRKILRELRQYGADV